MRDRIKIHMKIRVIIINILVLLFAINGYGQTCKVEFYLLKRVVESVDSTGMLSNFHVTVDDLEDTAFIKDDEITSFSIKKDTIDNKIRERHIFGVPKTVVERINKLEIPLCGGKQFALLVDGKIVYEGYFWNFYSSFGCNGIVATAFGESILIEKKLPDYGSEDNENKIDKRNNRALFDCLKSTNRMENEGID